MITELLTTVSFRAQRRPLLTVEEAVVRVGRGPGVDVVIDDDSVSRHHATFIRDGDVVLVQDEHSTNGTFVNGRRTAARELRDRDVVTFGRAAVTFRETRMA